MVLPLQNIEAEILEKLILEIEARGSPNSRVVLQLKFRSVAKNLMRYSKLLIIGSPAKSKIR